MTENEYVYAVARIRSKELTLFNKQTLKQLMACQDYRECLRFLTDKGWGDGTADAEELLVGEREKTWRFIEELVDDMSVFDVFLYQNDYHNLKAAIKQIYTQTQVPKIFILHGTVDPDLILKAVKEHDFSKLPERMQSAGEEAFRALLHTHDGQLCDTIIDKAGLDAIYAAKKLSDNEVLQKYAELTVAAADIKIAIRAMNTKKTLSFLKRALAKCDTLDAEKLARAAIVGMDAISDYLLNTPYAGAVPSIQKSLSAFERWCDNLMIEQISPQKYNPFTIAPLAAYILARENEIKTVRIILSGKLNHLSEESIRERMRDMYV